MQYITEDQFIARAASRGGYWRNAGWERWPYLSKVVELCREVAPTSALEIGTNGISLMDESDTAMGKPGDPDNPGRRAIVDVTRVPWPVEGKHYDLVVATQVFEHLSPHQPRVFAEIMRCSRACILSLPYLWNCPADPVHHNIGAAQISEWTLGEKPSSRTVITSPSGLRRVVLLWRW